MTEPLHLRKKKHWIGGIVLIIGMVAFSLAGSLGNMQPLPELHSRIPNDPIDFEARYGRADRTDTAVLDGDDLWLLKYGTTHFLFRRTAGDSGATYHLTNCFFGDFNTYDLEKVACSDAVARIRGLR